MKYEFLLPLYCINKAGSRNSYIICEILNNKKKGKKKEGKGEKKGWHSKNSFFFSFLFFLSLYLLHFRSQSCNGFPSLCLPLHELFRKKNKKQKNAKYVYLLPKGYIHLLFYLFFCPIRSGAPIKSGLVHISPVHGTGRFVYLQADPVDKSLLACSQVQWVPGQVALTQKRTRWFICTFIKIKEFPKFFS